MWRNEDSPPMLLGIQTGSAVPEEPRGPWDGAAEPPWTHQVQGNGSTPERWKRPSTQTLHGTISYTSQRTGVLCRQMSVDRGLGRHPQHGIKSNHKREQCSDTPYTEGDLKIERKKLDKKDHIVMISFRRTRKSVKTKNTFMVAEG